MITFWVIASLLMAGALLFLVPPLVRNHADNAVSRESLNIAIHKDQLRELEADLAAGTLSREQYDQARAELEKGLLESVSGAAPPATHSTVGKGSAIAVALAVPVLSIFLYTQLGGGAAALNPEQAQPAVEAAGHEGTIEQMIGTLEARLQSDPNSAEGWAMLGRSYYYLKRFNDASTAYGKAIALLPTADANLLADYADAMAMANNRRLTGRPMELITQALEQDPNHVKALWLAGTGAYEQQDHRGAQAYWSRLSKILPPGSEEAQIIQDNLRELARVLGEPAPVAEAEAAPTATGTPATITGMVSLDPAIASRASPDDTVFIFARAAQGPRAPLAIVRKQVRDLPISFTLDDSMAMNPAMKLSNFPEVVVGARTSKSGTATPQSGDLEGHSPVIAVGRSAEVRVTINNVVP